MALRDRLAALIAEEGPLCVGRYMDACLHDARDGYYATRPRLGEAGDFITAPLVSQIFGEILGLWAAEVWGALGRPDRFRLVELGPGQGTMIGDVLRAARLAPGFRAACELWLVETSAPLRACQAAALRGVAEPLWADRLDDLPLDAPIILLANEFLDCLPIRQAVRTRRGWRERRIGLGAEGALAFCLGEAVAPPGAPPAAPDGAVFEWSDAAARLGRRVGAMMAGCGGCALFVDYGRDAPDLGDTLQALRRHRKESPLAHPGEADLTAHVDFPAFLAAAREAGGVAAPVTTQGAFLGALGADVRAAALARARPDRAATIARQLERLTAPSQMGELFKVALVHAPGLAAPGFEP